MSLPPNTTLAEAKAWLRERMEDGEECPCCAQWVQWYPRQIHATMARQLIAIYRSAGREWFHLPSVVGHGGDIAKAAYWGLLEEEKKRREDGGRAGYWRLTDRGERYVRGELAVPKYARTYNRRVYGYRGELVTIVDALGSPFDYRELMGGAAA